MKSPAMPDATSDTPPTDPGARLAPAAPTPLGIYDRSRGPQVTGIEVTAVALSLVWLLGAAIFFVVLEPSNGTDDSLRFLMTMLAVFMPVGMIWVAATAARASRVMRDEATRLQTAIDALRHAYVSQSQGGASATSVGRKLDEIAGFLLDFEDLCPSLPVSLPNFSENPCPVVSGSLSSKTFPDPDPRSARLYREHYVKSMICISSKNYLSGNCFTIRNLSLTPSRTTRKKT